MLRYILNDVRLFDRKAATEASRTALLGFLESLTWQDQLWLREHPETPRLYDLHKEGKVNYLLPEQFAEGEVNELAPIVAAFKKHKVKDRAALDALDVIRQMIGGERFRDIPAVIENGGGDCDNLAAWRTAELRHAGILATPYITWKQRLGGGTTYHALVRWPDGTSEDPSLILGMGGADRDKERAEELRKNAERKQIAKDQLARALAAKVADANASTDSSVDDMNVDWGDL